MDQHEFEFNSTTRCLAIWKFVYYCRRLVMAFSPFGNSTDIFFALLLCVQTIGALANWDWPSPGYASIESRPKLITGCMNARACCTLDNERFLLALNRAGVAREPPSATRDEKDPLVQPAQYA